MAGGIAKVEKVGSRREDGHGNEGTVKNGGSQTKRLGDGKRQQGSKGKDLGRLEDPQDQHPWPRWRSRLTCSG